MSTSLRRLRDNPQPRRTGSPPQPGSRSTSERLLGVLGLREHPVPPWFPAVAGALVLTVIGGWAAALGFMTSVPFTGDESFYTDNAAAIAGLLRGQGDAGEVARDVVAYGWFMPGTSLLLTPLYLVLPDAGPAAVRLYGALVVFALWWWALRNVARTFGPAGALTLLAMPSLTPIWLLFANTAWGDVPAGLLLAVVCAHTYRLATGLFAKRPLRWIDVVVLEVAMAAMVYLRGNTVVVVVAVHVFLGALAVISRDWSRLPQRIAAVGIGAALFAALLAPWSVTASRVLDGTVVTTSSAALSLGITFGDTDRLCFGPCPEGGVWYHAVQFSREQAQQRGVGELAVQREMSASALEGLTPTAYARQARQNFASFIRPHGQGPRGSRPFVQRFAAVSDHDLSRPAVQRTTATLGTATLIVYVPFFLALIAANLAVFVRSRRLQLLSLTVKLFTVSLFLQPFLHPSHARYWVAFAPLMAVAATLFVHWRVPAAAPAATNGAAAATDEGAGDVVLTVLQAAYAVVIAAVALWLLTA